MLKKTLIVSKERIISSFGNKEALYKAVAQGMKVKLAANYGSVNHSVGYREKPIASLEQFEQQQIRDLYIRDDI